jgi:hypothetical protein
LLQVFKQKISLKVNMNIDTIKTNYRYLIIDSNADISYIVKTDRLVSKIMKDTYGTELSHMYINRNLITNDDHILIEGILIKVIW